MERRRVAALSLPGSARRMATAAAAAAGLGALGVFAFRRLLAQKKRAARKRGETAAADVAASGEGAGPRPASAQATKTPRVSLSRLLAILVPRLKDPSTARIAALVVLCVARTKLNDILGQLQGQLFKAVFTKRVPLFVELLLRNVLLNLGTSSLLSLLQYLVRVLALSWRSRLYTSIENAYFTDMLYYKLSFVDKRIENPEQIIARDVPKFCDLSADITFDLIKAVCDGAFFSYRLAQQTSPGWAMVSWAYVVSATVILRPISPPFGALNAIKLKLEGMYRRAMSNLQTHSEAVSALGGEQRELAIARGHFKALTSHMADTNVKHWWYGMVEDFIAKYCASTMAMVVILGPFFTGALKSDGSALGNAQTLATMRYVTSVIIHQLTGIAGLVVCLRKSMQLSGYAKRIGQLHGVLKELKPSSSAPQASLESSDKICFRDVEIHTPTGQKLVDGLSFEVEPGKNMLITGPNGAGKSSIFRCLGALWNIQAGSISKPQSEKSGLCGAVFYLPQKPYNVVGKLKDQITYPLNEGDEGAKALTDEGLRELLELVELEYLVDAQSDKEVNWESTLSLGETQRLAMARLFYHCPTFAILDECTSGVSNTMEERLYKLCREKGITCITISHRPALTAFHDARLALDGKGGYSEEQLEHAGDSPAANSPLAVRRHHSIEKTVAAVGALSSYDTLVGTLTKGRVSRAAQFWQLLAILVPTPTCPAALRLYGLAAVVVARVALSDRVAHLNGDTVSYLLRGDLPGFKRLVAISLGQCVMSSFLAPTLMYLTRELALGWRKSLSERIWASAYAPKVYYKGSQVYTDAFDIDQRLTEDLGKLCGELANSFPQVIKPIADLLWFTHQTWSLLGLRNTAVLYAYMVAGLGVLRLLTPDFGELTAEEQSLSGLFRYMHVRLRTHAESVAFFGGDDRERSIVKGSFKKLLAHEFKTARINLVYNTLEDFVIKQLPHIVTWTLSMIYTLRSMGRLSGVDPVGAALGHDLRFVASAVSHIFLAFGEILHLYKRFLELSGYSQRVIELDTVLRCLASTGLDDGGSDRAVTPSDHLSFHDVDVVTPDGRVLIHKLSCEVKAGQPLLVTGPNTSGKSSLFRVIGELWPARGGSIGKPCDAEGHASFTEVFLVPQRPYHVEGTLIDQVTYPKRLVDPSSDELAMMRDIMETVGLTHLLEREHGWFAEMHWADVLSLGEQQRIGMARLFFHKPKFAILDQCTDAVSVDVEVELYRHASALGITIITISQRPALIDHHSQELRLVDGKGAWELCTLHTPKGH